MQKRIRFGLIGLGRHGLRYATHLLETNPFAELTAVSRQDVQRGQEFAQSHHLYYFQNPRDLIHHSQVDAVILVIPPEAVLPLALEAIQASKPLIVEKPLTTSSSQARQIVEAARVHHVPLMTAQTLRLDPLLRQMKQSSGEVGTWKYLVLTQRLECRPSAFPKQRPEYQGALLQIGIHLLDLVRYLTDQEIQKVRCELDQPSAEAPEGRALVSIVTQKGLSCLLDVSRVSPTRVTRAEIIGERGQLIGDWTKREISLLTPGRTPHTESLPSAQTIPLVLSEFVTALRENRPMPITGTDGLRAVEIADACYESAKRDHWVYLSPNPI
jgi:predicted dehydrogenase